MKIFVLPILLLLSIQQLPAQDSTAITNNQVTRQGHRFFYLGHRLKGKKLEAEVCKVPAAVPYFNRYKTDFVFGYVLTIGGSLLIAATQKKDEQRSTVPQAVGLVSAGTGVALLIVGFNKLKQAVRLRNEGANKSVVLY